MLLWLGSELWLQSLLHLIRKGGRVSHPLPPFQRWPRLRQSSKLRTFVPNKLERRHQGARSSVYSRLAWTFWAYQLPVWVQRSLHQQSLWAPAWGLSLHVVHTVLKSLSILLLSQKRWVWKAYHATNTQNKILQCSISKYLQHYVLMHAAAKVLLCDAASSRSA